MGQNLSAEGDRITRECYTEVTTQEKLKRCFPDEYDDAYAKDLEETIVKNQATLTCIELGNVHNYSSSEEALDASRRYLEAAVRGLLRTMQGSAGRALLVLEIYLSNSIDIDEELLSKIVWASPRKLELTLSMNGSDNPGERSVFSRAADWSLCQLEEIKLSQVSSDEAALVSLLQNLAKLSSLVTLNLMVDGPSGGFVSSETTEAVTAILENNPNIHSLYLSDILPDKEPFCEQLAKSTRLTSLSLGALYDGEDHDNDDYFEKLAMALQNPDLPLEALDYGEGAEHKTAWGPSSIEYYVALNYDGRRQKMRGETLTSDCLCDMLAPYCGQSAKANMLVSAACCVNLVKSLPQKKNDDENPSDSLSSRAMLPTGLTPAAATAIKEETGLDDGQLAATSLMAGMASHWATTEEEQQLKDTCVLFGLLRESPGIWSKMALLAHDQVQNTKPAASKRKASASLQRATKKSRRTKDTRSC